MHRAKGFLFDIEATHTHASIFAQRTGRVNKRARERVIRGEIERVFLGNWEGLGEKAKKSV